MLLKKLIVIPTIAPFAIIPAFVTFNAKNLNKNSFSGSLYAPPSEEIKTQDEKLEKIPELGNKSGWERDLTRECKPFNNSLETMLVCPSFWGGTTPLFFYAKIEYKGQEKEIPSLKSFSQVKSLSYDEKTDSLIAEFMSNRNKVTVKKFPQEFKKLKNNSITPSKDCVLEKERLIKNEILLQCRFNEGGNYVNISLERE